MILSDFNYQKNDIVSITRIMILSANHPIHELVSSSLVNQICF